MWEQTGANRLAVNSVLGRVMRGKGGATGGSREGKIRRRMRMRRRAINELGAKCRLPYLPRGSEDDCTVQ